MIDGELQTRHATSSTVTYGYILPHEARGNTPPENMPFNAQIMHLPFHVCVIQAEGCPLVYESQ